MVGSYFHIRTDIQYHLEQDIDYMEELEIVDDKDKVEVIKKYIIALGLWDIEKLKEFKDHYEVSIFDQIRLSRGNYHGNVSLYQNMSLLYMNTQRVKFMIANRLIQLDYPCHIFNFGHRTTADVLIYLAKHYNKNDLISYIHNYKYTLLDCILIRMYETNSIDRPNLFPLLKYLYELGCRPSNYSILFNKICIMADADTAYIIMKEYTRLDSDVYKNLILALYRNVKNDDGELSSVTITYHQNNRIELKVYNAVMRIFKMLVAYGVPINESTKNMINMYDPKKKMMN
jgi:hypothetical protein